MIIRVAGTAINASAISFVDFRSPSRVSIVFPGNTVDTTDPEEMAYLERMFSRPAPIPEEPAQNPQNPPTPPAPPAPAPAEPSADITRASAKDGEQPAPVVEEIQAAQTEVPRAPEENRAPTVE